MASKGWCFSSLLVSALAGAFPMLAACSRDKSPGIAPESYALGTAGSGDQAVTGSGGQGGSQDAAAASPLVALFHFDGEEGSTSLIDSSGTGKIATIHGNPAISTAQSKFGGASLRIDGTWVSQTNFVSVAEDADLSFPGNFTMDWWQYAVTYTNAFGNYVTLVTPQDKNTCAYCAGAAWNSGGAGMHFVRYPQDSVPGPSTNQWHHVAITRSSGTFRAFVDGKLVATDVDYTPTVHGMLFITGLAGNGDNGDFNGYIDELRVIKDLALWTDSFTPPDRAFDPSGSGALTVASVSKKGGNNLGPVNLRVLGQGIEQGAVLRLSRDGAVLTSVAATVLAGWILDATLDLRGISPGPATLQIVNPSGAVAAALDAFTIYSPDSMLFMPIVYPGGGSASHGVLRFQFDSTGDYIEEVPQIPADLVNDPSYTAYTNHELFVANRHGNSGPASISRFLIDSAGNYVANGTITGNQLSATHGLAFRANGELLAANMTGVISRFVFDASGNAVPNGTIATNVANRGITVAPDGELWVTSCASSVARYRFDDSGVASYNGSLTVPGASCLHSVAFDSRGQLFLPDPYANAVFLVSFDSQRNPVFGSPIPIPGGPIGLAFSATNELFVTKHFSGGFTRYRFADSGAAIPNGEVATDHLGGATIAPLGWKANLSIRSLSRYSGGNAGTVTLRIIGSGFKAGAKVRLVRDGAALAESKASEVYSELVMDAVLDLRGLPAGQAQLEAANPDGSTIAASHPFTIESGGEPSLWVQIVSPDSMRLGREQSLTILYGNSGAVDLSQGAIAVRASDNATIRTTAPLAWHLTPGFEEPQNLSHATFLLYGVPAGSFGQITIGLTATGSGDSSLAAEAYVVDPSRDSVSVSNVGSPLAQEGTALAQPTALALLTSRNKASADPSFWRRTENVPAEGTIIFQDDPSSKGLPTGHVGIIYVHNDSKVYVWENLPDGSGTRLTPWSEFVDRTFVKKGWIGTYDTQLSQSERQALHQKMWDDIRYVVNSKGDKTLMNAYGEPLPFRLPDLKCTDAVHQVFKEACGRDLIPGHRHGIWDAPGFDYWMLTGHPWGGTSGPVTFWLLSEWLDGVEQAMLSVFRMIDKTRSLLHIVVARDPNGKYGSIGSDSARYVRGQQALGYVIAFENIASATAPAQDVTISDHLQPSLANVDSFAFGAIAIGEKTLAVPAGVQNYVGYIDLVPTTNLLVKVEANLAPLTGLVTWKFSSIDPATGLPPADPLAGFLPPNVTPPEGEGSVMFTVQPKAGLPTGTQIKNKATIIFDNNAPIETAEWLNTIDNSKPASQVTALAPRQAGSTFQVCWSGSDEGAGIKDYTVYVSDNGGPTGAWLTNTTDSCGTFAGQAGHSYAFYSIARDQVGNVEEPPTQPDASTVAGYPGCISAADCDDGDVCTEDTCTTDGSCRHVGASCDDGDPCTLDSCIPAQGCVHTRQCPVCTAAAATVDTLWPPDHAMVTVGVTGVTDPQGQTTTISIQGVRQDEPTSAAGENKMCPDASPVGQSTVSLRAERDGNGNGRVYHLYFTATDPDGYSCAGEVRSCVPHDQGKGSKCIDGGALYNSLLCPM
jgi:hypothetical protein